MLHQVLVGGHPEFAARANELVAVVNVVLVSFECGHPSAGLSTLITGKPFLVVGAVTVLKEGEIRKLNSLILPKAQKRELVSF